MMLRHTTLPKFLMLSLGIHLVLLGGTFYLSPEKHESKNYEISFNSGVGGQGGSGNSVKLLNGVKSSKITSTSKKTVLPKTAVASANKVVHAATPTAETGKNSSSDTVSGSDQSTGSGEGLTAGSGSGSNDPMALYRGKIYKLLNSKKKYPRMAQALKQEGRVLVKIIINKNGKLIDLEVVEPSRYSTLEKATLDSIKGIEEFPKIPSELNLDSITFNVPFEYKTDDGDTI